MIVQILGMLVGLFLALCGIASFVFGALATLVELFAPTYTDPILVRGILLFLWTVSAFLLWYGPHLLHSSKRAFEQAREERRNRPSEAVLRAQPWLRNPSWRKREIEFSTPVQDSYLVAAWVFFAPLSLCGFWFAFFVSQDMNGDPVPLLPRLMMLAIGVGVALPLVYLSYARARKARYGTSVCKLLSLPAEVGGRLEADVVCRLPEGFDDFIVVRLKNLAITVKTVAGKAVPQAEELWRTEQRLVVPTTPQKQSVVPVRLPIPRTDGQVPMTIDGSDSAKWILEVEKEAKGIDFYAAFAIPVYDLSTVKSSQGARSGNG